jgi:hypothetical protein
MVNIFLLFVRFFPSFISNTSIVRLTILVFEIKEGKKRTESKKILTKIYKLA